MNYVELVAETCIRKILGSDDTVAKKATYIAETLGAVIRLEVVEEVEDAFGALGREVELERMNAESKQERESYGVALESLDSVRQTVVNRIR